MMLSFFTSARRRAACAHVEDMNVRRFSEKTRNDYIRNVRAFAAFIGPAGSAGKQSVPPESTIGIAVGSVDVSVRALVTTRPEFQNRSAWEDHLVQVGTPDCNTKNNPAPSATRAPTNIQVELKRFGRDAVGTTSVYPPMPSAARIGLDRGRRLRVELRPAPISASGRAGSTRPDRPRSWPLNT